MNSQPIKRTEELKPLSREHHLGLLFIWKIKEGVKLGVDPSRLRSYLNYFWEGHLKQHFLHEEALLFNKIDAVVCKQAMADHVVIGEQLQQINQSLGADHSAYLLLANTLMAHIRFEERTVFPYLEQNLSAGELNEVPFFLANSNHHEFEDSYPDEFWIKMRKTTD